MREFLFLGVSTQGSTATKLFPLWSEIMGMNNVELKCINVPIGAKVEGYSEFFACLREHQTMGSLITSHKAAIFGLLDGENIAYSETAQLLQEASCIYYREGCLVADAPDVNASFPVLRRLTSSQQWSTGKKQVVIIGAGGAGLSLLSALRYLEKPPSVIKIVERNPHRLVVAKRVCEELKLGANSVIDFRIDEFLPGVIEEMAEGSLIVNASGIGKDRPGEVVNDFHVLPKNSIVWEFNYRGNLDLLTRATADANRDNLIVEDGWEYFIRGWLNHMALVFSIDQPELYFSRFEEVAKAFRLPAAPN